MFLLLHTAEAITNTAPPNTLIYLLAAITGGGAITGLVSWIRLRKTGGAEKEEIISKAAEKAVLSLQVSLTRLEAELDEARYERDKLDHLLKEAVTHRKRLEEKLKTLTERIRVLEHEVEHYKEIVDKNTRTEGEKT